MPDEKTSPEVASDAASALNIAADRVATLAARIVGMSDALIRGLAYRDPEAIRAVAASALTQKAKPKPRKRKADATDPKA